MINTFRRNERNSIFEILGKNRIFWEKSEFFVVKSKFGVGEKSEKFLSFWTKKKWKIFEFLTNKKEWKIFEFLNKKKWKFLSFLNIKEKWKFFWVFEQHQKQVQNFWLFEQKKKWKILEFLNIKFFYPYRTSSKIFDIPPKRVKMWRKILCRRCWGHILYILITFPLSKKIIMTTTKKSNFFA